jgi:hypothetical protein
MADFCFGPMPPSAMSLRIGDRQIHSILTGGEPLLRTIDRLPKNIHRRFLSIPAWRWTDLLQPSRMAACRDGADVPQEKAKGR